MLRVTLAMLSASLLMVPPGMASDIPGAELIAECRKPQPSYCLGYVQAWSEGIMTQGTTICIDHEATSRDEITRSVAAWIAAYKGDPAQISVYEGFTAVFPCEDDSGGL